MPSSISYFRLSAAIMFAVAVLACGCDSEMSPIANRGKSNSASFDLNPTTARGQVRVISESENLIQSLSPQVKLIAKALSGDSSELAFVSADLKCIGIEDGEIPDAKYVGEGASKLPAWSFEPGIASAANTGTLQDIFKPLVDGGKLSDVQIGTLGGKFTSPDVFETKTKLEAKLENEAGGKFGLKGYQKMKWVNDDGWKLTQWSQEKLKVTASPKHLFEDVTLSAIPDEKTRKQIQSSSHQDLIRELAERASLLGGELDPPRWRYKGLGDWFSSYQFPSVSVLDLDQDGFDDLYVTDRWQSGQLLRNNGDGTFSDVTESSGLVIKEVANCVYFADFDNDGDSDAFVGISMGPSRFYINNDGKFELDEANTKTIEDSRFVTAASVVDVNGDGLLDLYLSTYAFGFGAASEWHKRATREADQMDWMVRLKKQHPYVDRAGPPNILLMNRNGKFEWVEIDDTLKQFHDCYQTCWTDIDNDGDMDAYVCNDFASDAILRNDTVRGSFEPVFVDVADQLISNPQLNFAMGASLGDCDNDGDLDLYVSNMYSKAGMRICKQIDSVDPRITVSARGNFLYRNDDGKLTQIAGLDDGDQQVAMVGWSYGGQFGDFNNDGNLDLYVPSGFYSPPKELQTDKDL